MNTFDKYNKCFVPKTWKEKFKSKAHLITIIQDSDTDLIIYKRWNKHQQYWVYSVEQRWVFGHSRALVRELNKKTPIKEYN